MEVVVDDLAAGPLLEELGRPGLVGAIALPVQDMQVLRRRGTTRGQPADGKRQRTCDQIPGEIAAARSPPIGIAIHTRLPVYLFVHKLICAGPEGLSIALGTGQDDQRDPSPPDPKPRRS